MTDNLNALENSCISKSPLLLIRGCEGDIKQLAGGNATITTYNLGSDGIPLIAYEGIFAKKSLRLPGGSLGNYVRVSRGPVFMPTAAISIVVVISSIRNTVFPSGNGISIISCAEAGGYQLALYSDGKVYLYVNTSEGYRIVGFDKNVLKVSGSIVHATYDGRYIIIYVDGVVVASNDFGATRAIVYSSSTDLLIGAEPGSNNLPIPGSYYCDCDISLVAIYGNALTSTDVLVDNELFSSPKMVAGTAVLDDGSPASGVVVRSWVGERSAYVVPDSNGSWNAPVPDGDYLVTALGPAGYRPISHGPVTAVDP